MKIRRNIISKILVSQFKKKSNYKNMIKNYSLILFN